jgi:acetyl-CoA carboxylase biotin carboxylase subunit
MFDKILIANRGEIALRVLRACKELGIATVAVHSTADADAMHVRLADESVCIGPPPSKDSYLNIPSLLATCEITGADAVHPGYGFLAERAAFAEAVEQAGLVFVGPPPAAIRAMGDKTEARRRMLAANVPVVPGAQEPVRDLGPALALAREIGYPVLVKAAAGGGGKGMRVVHQPEQLEPALATAASEARKAFGDPSVYLEKLILQPRHVEIQVLADHERTAHLGERECSIQRRHQKLVEEAPSVAVSAALRAEMGAAAVAAAEAVGYRGAGTCEFLLGAGGRFYFLEMNTRIQVEHPVTELVYGVDLVREQLRIAGGERMRVHAGTLHPRGWAIECRITSEDPASGFLPTTGRVSWLRPPAGPGVRWDAGIEVGSEVTLYYDSMLAKLIAWAPTREQAITRMRRALDELQLHGVATNQQFHARLLADPAFIAGDIDIQFLDRRPDLMQADLDEAELTTVAIAAALAEDEQRRRKRVPLNGTSDVTDSEWARLSRREALQ